ncbi:uncharacterized protein LOC101778603 [Setaria italica]|uniref:uncharacterized protein LOC101778603 n=1 Tax=Setaria italica TaxID=4555 RepID=UPI00035087C1|nr:uncharacterized protein LOC101778603 [Setaria italica]
MGPGRLQDAIAIADAAALELELAHMMGHTILSGMANYRMEYLTFDVANFKTSYHTILGQPMLARFMAIPHHTYLVLKIRTPDRVLSVYGDIETSYKCDTKVVQLAEALEYSAKATTMVGEAQKMDKD